MYTETVTQPVRVTQRKLQVQIHSQITQPLTVTEDQVVNATNVHPLFRDQLNNGHYNALLPVIDTEVTYFWWSLCLQTTSDQGISTRQQRCFVHTVILPYANVLPEPKLRREIWKKFLFNNSPMILNCLYVYLQLQNKQQINPYPANVENRVSS